LKPSVDEMVSTAMIGIYRPDEIHWNKAAGKEARR